MVFDGWRKCVDDRSGKMAITCELMGCWHAAKQSLQLSLECASFNLKLLIAVIEVKSKKVVANMKCDDNHFPLHFAQLLKGFLMKINNSCTELIKTKN